MAGTFCPFVNGPCKSDCMFSLNGQQTPFGVPPCLIAAKLSDINGEQKKQLQQIIVANRNP